MFPLVALFSRRRFHALAAISLLVFCASLSRADEAADIASAKSLSRAFRAVAKRVIPCVVKIKTTVRPRALSMIPAPSSANRSSDATSPAPFSDRAPGFVPAEMPARAGLGSGVVIDSQGIILTNYHVVEGADEVTVELADGRQYRAEDVRSDESSDLAVLRIKVDHRLQAATLGDSDKLEIGDWVLALGHPFDLDLTVSAGIISGKARVLPSGGRASFLQTDAAINPGNSGGPLVNLDGEVVGIDTAIASHSGTNQGVGFAIPANLAKWVARQLIDRGSVQRAYLGVRIEQIDGRQADELGIEPDKGVLIADVIAESPAAKAGLHPKDRILQFDGHDVQNPRQLQEIVERAPLETPQSIKIIRDGKPRTFAIAVCPLPKSLGLAGAIMQAPNAATGLAIDSLGVKIADLAKADIDRFNYQGFRGALVKEVRSGGVAEQAGLRGGMLVMQVDTTAVHSVVELRRAIKQQSLSKGVMLLVRTPEGGNRLVTVKSEIARSGVATPARADSK